jgi:hypothetical protein
MNPINRQNLMAALGAFAAAVIALPAQADQPRISELTCDAYNMLGYAHMVYDPAKETIVSTVNYGQMILSYQVADVVTTKIQAAGQEPEMGVDGIKLAMVASKEQDKSAYRLKFTKAVKLGERQTVGGTFSHVTTWEKTEGEAKVTKEALTPIAFVNCSVLLSAW